MSYTKGPWSLDKNGSITDKSGKTIVASGIALAGEGYKDVKGNTLLIAAAPDLLEVTEQLAEILQHEYEAGRICGIHVRGWLEEASDAVAKAKGIS